MYDTVRELHNDLLEIYFYKYKAVSDGKKGKLGNKYDPINLFLETYNYNVWFENEELSDATKTDEKSTDLPPMPPLESDEEEAKERKRSKILTPNKLLTRLSTLLAQIKAGNNSYKLKDEFKQILYFLYQHNKIIKRVYNSLIKLL